MKIRMKTWQILLVLLLSVSLPVFILAQQTKPCKGSHTRKDFYKSVRMLSPANVLEIVGNRLNYATSDEGIELGSLELEDNYSIVPKDFATKHSGCFGILYCSAHLVVLRIDELPADQCHLKDF